MVESMLLERGPIGIVSTGSLSWIDAATAVIVMHATAATGNAVAPFDH